MTSDKLALARISEEAFRNYGIVNSSGMAYFASFLEGFANADPDELIVFQVRHYPLRYVLDLLLSAPSLWTSMSTEQWANVLTTASPRPAPRRGLDDLDFYSDIVFLCKYLNLDAVRFLFQLPHVSHADKESTAAQLSIYGCLLVLDKVDGEDLDGEYFVSRSELDMARSHLLREGGFVPFEYDEHNLQQYFAKLGDLK